MRDGPLFTSAGVTAGIDLALALVEWRDALVARGLGGSTRHRFSALSSLFEYLCERSAITHNPVKGVKRPHADSAEGRTPAIGDRQARELLAAPATSRLKRHATARSCRPCSITRCAARSLCKFTVKDFKHTRHGVAHMRVSVKSGKTGYVPLHPATSGVVHDYLAAAGHGEDDSGALFRPIRNNRTGRLDEAVTPDGIYKLVRAYAAELGLEIGVHALRATAATNALDHQADIAKVQEWLS